MALAAHFVDLPFGAMPFNDVSQGVEGSTPLPPNPREPTHAAVAPFHLPPSVWGPPPGHLADGEAFVPQTDTQEDFGWLTSNTTTAASATFGAVTGSAVQTFGAIQSDTEPVGVSKPAMGSSVDSTADFRDHRKPDGPESFPEDMRWMVEGFSDGQPPERPADPMSDPSKNMAFSFSSEALRLDLYYDVRFSELAAVSSMAVTGQQVFSEASTQPVYQEHVWSSDNSMATSESGAAQDLSLFGADVPENVVEDIPSEGLVEIHSLDDGVLSLQANSRQSELEQKIDDLLRALHTPPKKSIEQSEEAATQGDSIPGKDIDDGPTEGGMVLLEAGGNSNTGKAFVADHVFAELGELFDVDVKMEPAVGAYRAFDIVSQSNAAGQEVNRPAPCATSSSVEEEKDAGSVPQRERVSKRAATGILLAAAATAYAGGNLRRASSRKAKRVLKP